jgi:mono/diheme cytochrome c family protein
MYTGMLHTHKLVVTLFLLLYLIKTILLLLNKRDSLIKFTAKTKVLEMIVSVLFLATGIFLASKSGNVGTWLWVKIAAIAISIPVAVIGFKNQNKGLAFLSLLLIVYSYGISETKSPNFKKEKAAILAAGDPLVLGQDVYTKLCQNCHGVDGKLMLSGAKDLSISTLTKEEQILIITKGKNTMAAYESQLSQQQIEAVAAYIETLKTK